MATTTLVPININPCFSKRNNFSFVFQLMLILLVIGVSKGQLTPNFYSSSCPNLLSIIRTAVNNQVQREPRMGASLLRLHYNDCFVNGCDASVLLDDTRTFTGEKSADQNVNSLRGFDVIDNIKSRVERACPGVVSCADILAVAARDAVVSLGGPNWSVLVGRRDSVTASLSDANSQIPAPTLNLSGLITSFSNKGFNTRELVALSGAHTIGQARCSTFRDRVYNETISDQARLSTLRSSCPTSGGDNNLQPLDTDSSTSFDTSFFTNLVSGNGLLHSDQQLFGRDSTSDDVVREYSTNSASFFNDFPRAMIKMSRLSPLTGRNGQIRFNCRRVN